MQKSSESCPLHVQELNPFVKFQAFDSGFCYLLSKSTKKYAKIFRTCPFHVQELNLLVTFQTFDSGCLLFAIKNDQKLCKNLQNLALFMCKNLTLL